jgi:hypothetical protein
MPPAAEPLPFALSVYRIVTAAAGAALAPLHPVGPTEPTRPFGSPKGPGKIDRRSRW